MKKLCLGKAKVIWKKVDGDIEVVGSWHSPRPLNIKRIRMKCEICGRKIFSSVMMADWDIVHYLPPHKPKGWWKKKKNKKHKERNIRPCIK